MGRSLMMKKQCSTCAKSVENEGINYSVRSRVICYFYKFKNIRQSSIMIGAVSEMKKVMVSVFGLNFY